MPKATVCPEPAPLPKQDEAEDYKFDPSEIESSDGITRFQEAACLEA